MLVCATHSLRLLASSALFFFPSQWWPWGGAGGGQAGAGGQPISVPLRAGDEDLYDALSRMRTTATVPEPLARWCEQDPNAVAERRRAMQPRVTSLAQLQQLLQSHIVRGIVPSTDFADGRTITAINGQQWTITCASSQAASMQQPQQAQMQTMQYAQQQGGVNQMGGAAAQQGMMPNIFHIGQQTNRQHAPACRQAKQG